MPKPTIVTETTIIKNERRPVGRILGCISFLISSAALIFFITTIVMMGLWIRTWAVFTQERVVGYVTVGGLKTDSFGNKTFSLTYEGLDQEAAFGRLFPWGDKTISHEKFTVDNFAGDSFIVKASFFKWKDWLTFLGTPPLYKISSIRGDYYNGNEFNQKSSRLRSISVNGGEDDFWRSVLEGKSIWNFGAEARYVANPEQLVTNKEQKYEIVVTEDSMILRAAN